MASTGPPLRRSKRNQVSAKPVPKPIPADAPAPKKRGRKAADSLAEPAPKRPRQPNQPLPPFLTLPRELRDEIYKYVLEDAPSALKPGSRNLITRCGLVGVNNQICEEFLDTVFFHAPVITTVVKNHNFAHVVTFLNRLSEAQLARLSCRGANAALKDARVKRKIRITLRYTAGAKDSRTHLNRWLDRFDVPDKRGKELEFEYVRDISYRDGMSKQKPRTRVTASARWNEEARKIVNAFYENGWY